MLNSLCRVHFIWNARTMEKNNREIFWNLFPGKKKNFSRIEAKCKSVRKKKKIKGKKISTNQLVRFNYGLKRLTKQGTCEPPFNLESPPFLALPFPVKLPLRHRPTVATPRWIIIATPVHENSFLFLSLVESSLSTNNSRFFKAYK